MSELTERQAGELLAAHMDACGAANSTPIVRDLCDECGLSANLYCGRCGEYLMRATADDAPADCTHPNLDRSGID